MNFFGNLKIRFKLMALVAVFLIELIIFGGYAYSGLNTVKVNGPIYAQIVLGKDLIADILPPPAYIIESYLNCLQMLEAVESQADAATLTGLIDKATTLRQEYDARHQFWATTLDEGKLKQLMAETAYVPAQAFYQARDEAFVPAIRAGDLTRARKILRENLEPTYREHRLAIDQTVQLTVANNQTIEQSAQALIVRTTLSMIGLGLGCVLLTLVMGAFLSQLITRPLEQVAQAAARIADGDLEQTVNIHTHDETGQLAATFSRMIAYLQGMCGVAEKMAGGDLSEDIIPLSAQDGLGQAFAKMITALRQSVEQVAANATSVSAAAEQLAGAAEQAGSATAQQTQATAQSVNSVEEMRQVINGVAQGAQEQAAAVGQASAVTAQIATAIQNIANNAQAVSRDAQATAQAAHEGTLAIQATVRGMRNIKTKVGVSASKMQEMRQRSNQMGVTKVG